MLLYYITNRKEFSGTEAQRQAKLLKKIAEAASSGVDFIQLREKDLSAREMEFLARDVVGAMRSESGKTRLLINSRTDIALAAGADGLHLRSADISPQEVRKIWHAAGQVLDPVISVSCHSEDDVARATEAQANFVVFGPVFEKRDPPGTRATGLDALRFASRHKIPVLALGGVSVSNTAQCLEAGAAGIAGIRLFQTGEIARTVAQLRRLEERLC